MRGEPDGGDPAPERLLAVTDEASGLEAFIVVDAIEDERSVGGIHRAPYPTREAAMSQGKRQARATTLACRAAELPSGGAAVVIRDRDDLDLDRAYRVLGEQIDRIEPSLLCGSGQGTGAEELAIVQEGTDRVLPEGGGSASATAVGVLTGIQAVLWALEGDPTVEGSRFLVQGYGAVGAKVANGLADQGGMVIVAETDGTQREAADEAGFTTIEPQGWVDAAADVLVPCASGGEVTVERAKRLAAHGVCGAVDDPLASWDAAEVLHERNVQYAPAPLVNGGALVESVLTWRDGASQRVDDAIDRRLSDVYDRTRSVLEQAAREDRLPDRIVRDRWG